MANKNEIFVKGIRNIKFLETLATFKSYEIKYLVFNLFYMFTNKYDATLRNNNIKLSYGSIHLSKLMVYDDLLTVTYGNMIKDKRNPNIYNYYKFSVKVKILIEYIYNVIIHKFDKYYIYYYLEFLNIKSFVEQTYGSLLTISHFDRLTVWMSYLAKDQKRCFIISQHGLVGKISLPEKVHADKVYAFSKYEQEIFKKYIISNDSCSYSRAHYISNVKFENYNREDDKKYIFLASQPRKTQLTISTIKKIIERYNNVVIFLKLHPFEKVDTSLFKKNSNVILTKQFFLNVDVVLTYYSTIIYDFLSNGFENNIICQLDETFKQCDFFDSDFVIGINSIEDLYNILDEM